jgi:hypothetical protein
MPDLIISDYAVSLYILLWNLYFLIHGIVRKAPNYFIAWAASQLIIYGLLVSDSISNNFSGIALISILKPFFATNFDKNTVNFLRLVGITGVFFVIMKMHNYIEDIRSK